ncbi:MAG: aminotransferase class I/II-fold pyridoxal phosphate-dependent enzyme, partial [Butyricicoccaceae bacterium]
ITQAQFDAVYERARACGATILLDECFGSLCQPPESLYQGQEGVILLGSFTKSFAMPDIRLGYCRSTDRSLIARLYACGQPWAVTGAAQAAGLAALEEDAFLARSREYIAEQRAFLICQLRRLGFRVIEGQANFLLCQAQRAICAALEERGILLRSCADFEGLDDTWFRIAVRTAEENRMLIRTLEGR